MRALSYIVPSLALVCLGQSLTAADSTDDINTDVVVITAQKTETELSRITGTIHLLDDERLMQAGYQPQLTESLKGLRGVYTYNTGGLSGNATIRLRGASGSGTQIVKDGVPFNDPSTPQGNADMALSADAGVRSIEVAMGPQSTLYGSKAIGGLVNLVPLTASEEAEGFVRIGVGSFETRQVHMQATGPISETIGYAIGYSSVDSAGVSVQTADGKGDPEGYEKDAYDKQSIYLRAEYRPIEGVALTLIRDESDATTEFDGFSAPDSTTEYSDIHSEKTQLNADFTSSDVFEIHARIAKTQYERLLPNTQASAFYRANNAYESSETYASLAGFYHINDVLTTSLGFESRKEDLDIVPVDQGTYAIIAHEATHRAVWAQAAYTADVYEFDVSMRNENHSIAQSATTWHTGAAYFLMDDALKVHVSAGTAFRAPSLSELNFGVTDAANLEAEKSVGMELGATYFYDNSAHVGFTLWKTDYTQRIIYTGVWPNVLYANDDKGEDVTGGDVFAEYLFADVDTTLAVNATFQSPEKDTGLETRLPETMLNVQATWSPKENTWVSLEIQYTGDRKASSFASNTDDLEAYTLVHLSVGHALSDNVIIDAQIRNAADEVYTPARDYAGIPRQVSVGVTAEF